MEQCFLVPRSAAVGGALLSLLHKSTRCGLMLTKGGKPSVGVCCFSFSSALILRRWAVAVGDVSATAAPVYRLMARAG
jgi:hypothetical protein